ncbi:MAG: PDZ domain-containing protein [Nitrososphaerales archaeon]
MPVKAEVIVARVIHGSPAYRVGISEGDLIVRINGTSKRRYKTCRNLFKRKGWEIKWR